MFPPRWGGRIEAEGFGPTVAFTWEGNNGFYGGVKASATFYKLDFSSSSLGGLARDVKGMVLTYGLEAGQRIPLDLPFDLTARTWLGKTETSLARGLQDRVGSRVAIEDAGLVETGAGIDFERVLVTGGGQLKLQGSVGVRHMLAGDTKISINHERFATEGTATQPLLDAGISWRRQDLELDARLSTVGLGSDNYSVTGLLGLQYSF